MTRERFEDQINDWNELLDLCSNYDLSACDDIVDDYWVAECIRRQAANVNENNWENFAIWVEGIPRGEYHLYYDGEDFQCLDDEDFDSFKNHVLDEMLNLDLFDIGDEDERENNLLAEPEEEDGFEPDESLSISELVVLCCADISAIEQENAQHSEFE